MERGGANFLPSPRQGAVTSFVMLPCLQKVQLQIISQLWETPPPGVNNSPGTPEPGFAPEGEALEQARCPLSQLLPRVALMAPCKLSSPIAATAMVGLTADGLKDLTLEGLWDDFSAGPG